MGSGWLAVAAHRLVDGGWLRADRSVRQTGPSAAAQRRARRLLGAAAMSFEVEGRDGLQVAGGPSDAFENPLAANPPAPVRTLRSASWNSSALRHAWC